MEIVPVALSGTKIFSLFLCPIVEAGWLQEDRPCAALVRPTLLRSNPYGSLGIGPCSPTQLPTSHHHSQATTARGGQPAGYPHTPRLFPVTYPGQRATLPPLHPTSFGHPERFNSAGPHVDLGRFAGLLHTSGMSPTALSPAGPLGLPHPAGHASSRRQPAKTTPRANLTPNPRVNRRAY